MPSLMEMQQLMVRTEELCTSVGDKNPAAQLEMRELLRRSKELTVELMRENEQLRIQALLLEKQKLEAEQRLDNSRLGKENEQLKAELNLLTTRLGELERKSNKFRNRYEEIERYNMALSNVYVASSQLHSTLDFTEVVKTAEEILWNLIAAPKFAILLRDERGDGLKLVGGLGIEGRFPGDKISAATGMLAEAINTGEIIALEGTHVGDPLACVPLKVEGRGVVGLIAVYEIEEHKGELNALDRELFELLGNQTATAMSSSKVYSETVKKLKSMESFISLIKPE